MGTFPGSLSEGAGSPQGLTEGVSSDGSTGLMIYTPAHINSEFFERLRSSKYTPSVSHSLDSSLREGAGRGGCHSTCRPEAVRFRAIFIAPTELKNRFPLPFNGRHSLREGAGEGRVPFIVPSGNRKVAGDFHRPYETQKPFPFTIHRGTLPQSRIRSTAPSGREPGTSCTVQRLPHKP